VNSAVHTASLATRSQLVFGRNALLDVSFEANWQHVKERKQKLVTQNNKRENTTRIPHKCNVGDVVMFHTGKQRKRGHDPNLGPCWTTHAHDNGTVQLIKVADDNGRAICETWNIRNVNPRRT